MSTRGMRQHWGYYKLTNTGWETVAWSEVNQPDFIEILSKNGDTWMLIEEYEQDWLEDGIYSHATEGYDTIWTNPDSQKIYELLRLFGDKRSSKN